MKKRLLSILLVAAMVVAMVPAMVFATSAATTVTDWDAKEIVLMTADDFVEFKSQLRGASQGNGRYFVGQTVKLGADINLSGKTIKDTFAVSGFYGTFDGQGHTISNLTFNYPNSSYVGALFGTVDLSNLESAGLLEKFNAEQGQIVIKNFALRNSTATSKARATALFASAFISVTFENVYIDADVTGAADCAAGFVGDVGKGTITFKNCIYEGTVKSSPMNGAFVGRMRNAVTPNATVVIDNCLNASEQNMVGGYDGGTSSQESLTNCIIYNSANRETVGEGLAAQTYLDENNLTAWSALNEGYPVPTTLVSAFFNDKMVDWNAETIEIWTPAQFAAFRSKIESGMHFDDQTVLLTADIDMAGYALSPYSATAAGFYGVFDGQYHTLSNVSVSEVAAYTGTLFGCLGTNKNATIKNLGIVNLTSTNYANSGTLYGNVFGALTVENVYINATITNKSGTGVGGFVGRINSDGVEVSLAFENCAFDGKMTTSSYKVSPFVGVLESTAMVNELSFTNCLINGTFLQNSSEWLGGGKFICTNNQTTANITYTDCIQYNDYYQGLAAGYEEAGPQYAACPEWTGIGSGLTAKTPEGFTARNTSYPVPTTLLPFFADSINGARTNEAEDLVTEYYSAQERVADDGTLDVRLIGLANITAEDLVNYNAIGFEVVAVRQANGKVWSNTDENGDATLVYDVYTSYLEDGREISVDGSYVYMYALTGIEANKGIVTFAIKSFYVDANGAKTYTDMFVLNYDTALA